MLFDVALWGASTSSSVTLTGEHCKQQDRITFSGARIIHPVGDVFLQVDDGPRGEGDGVITTTKEDVALE